MGMIQDQQNEQQGPNWPRRAESRLRTSEGTANWQPQDRLPKGGIGQGLRNQREQNRPVHEALADQRANDSVNFPADGIPGVTPSPTPQDAARAFDAAAGQQSRTPSPRVSPEQLTQPIARGSGAGRAGSGGGSTPFPQNRNTPQQSSEIPMGNGIRMARGQQGEPYFHNQSVAPDQGRGGFVQAGGPSAADRFNRAADIYAQMNQQRRGGGGGPSVNIPQQPMRDELMGEHQNLQRMLDRGLSTRRRGDRLTADGVQALTGRMDGIEDSLRDYDMAGLDAHTGLAQQQMRNQGQLAQQQMRNQGQLAQTQAQTQGQISRDAAATDQNIRQSYATGEAQQNQLQTQIMRQSGIEPIPMQDLDSLAEMGDLSGEAMQQAMAQNQNIQEANALLTDAITRMGDPSMASQQLADMEEGFMESMNDPEELQAVMESQQFGDESEALQFLENRRQQARMARQQLLSHLPGTQMPQQPVPGFADGGLVSAGGPAGPIQGPEQAMSVDPMQMGSSSMDPMQQASPAADPVMGQMAMQQYQQYAQTAREMGLPPIGFEEFLSMQSEQGQAPGMPTAPEMQGGGPAGMPEMQPDAEAAQQVMGFADGGPVPEPGGGLASAAGEDVSGRMVMDPNPASGEDSIPAVIDGQQPAALDSGELVFPKDVVLYYGTQKLQSMIDKAREKMQSGEVQGGEPTPAPAPMQGVMQSMGPM